VEAAGTVVDGLPLTNGGDYIGFTDFGSAGEVLYQRLSPTYQAGTYTFTGYAAIRGNTGAGAIAGSFGVGLFIDDSASVPFFGDTSVATGSTLGSSLLDLRGASSPQTLNTFATAIAVIPKGSPLIGQNIVVAFNPNVQAVLVFDNFTLDFTPIPEPASNGVLGAGVRLCARRRQHACHR